MSDQKPPGDFPAPNQNEEIKNNVDETEREQKIESIKDLILSTYHTNMMNARNAAESLGLHDLALSIGHCNTLIQKDRLLYFAKMFVTSYESGDTYPVEPGASRPYYYGEFVVQNSMHHNLAYSAKWTKDDSEYAKIGAIFHDIREKGVSLDENNTEEWVNLSRELITKLESLESKQDTEQAYWKLIDGLEIPREKAMKARLLFALQDKTKSALTHLRYINNERTESEENLFIRLKAISLSNVYNINPSFEEFIQDAREIVTLSDEYIKTKTNRGESRGTAGDYDIKKYLYREDILDFVKNTSNK